MTVHPSLLREQDLPVEFGRFRLTGVLGEGGMARVFDAELHGEDRFRKRVALKVIHPVPGLDHSELSAAIANEARLGALLEHPNIVDTYDYGTHEGHPWIAMERIAGLPLLKVLNYERPLPVVVALRVAQEIARALDHAHGVSVDGQPSPVVHRDLKPANVFLTTDLGIKLMDFGIATSTSAIAHRFTEPGRTKGTPAFMSPEQAAGMPVGPPSDVFALGLVLYELLTGRLLLGGTNPLAALGRLAHLHKTLQDERVGERLEAIESGLAPLVLSTLRKEPAHRPLAAAFEAELESKIRSLGSGHFHTWARRVLARAGLMNEPPAPDDDTFDRTEAVRAVVGARHLDLMEAAVQVATSETQDEAAHLTVEFAYQWLAAGQAALYGVQEDELRLRAVLGGNEDRPPPNALARGEGSLAALLERSASITLGAWRGEDGWESLVGDGFEQVLPLVHRARTAGVLVLGDSRQREAALDHAVSKTLGASLAAVDARVQAEGRARNARRDLHQLGLLVPVAEKVAVARTWSAMLQEMLEDVVGSVRAQRGSLFLVDPTGQRLEVRAVAGLDPQVQADVNDGVQPTRAFGRGEGIAGRVWQQERPIRIERPAKDPRFDGQAAGRMVSLLCVPVFGPEDVLGVVNLSNRRDGGAFSARDEQTTAAAAHRIARLLSGDS